MLRPNQTVLLSALYFALLMGLSACQTSPGGPLANVLPSREQAHAPRESVFDVEHYSLEIELRPETRSFAGTCSVRLQAREAGLQEVVLDLVGLDVNAVRDSEGQSYFYEHAGGVLKIPLTEALDPGRSLELSIEYGGRPLKGLWFSAERDGVPTQVFTQGECEDSRFWFPCWDFPSDRATSELAVTLPASWTSIAAGELVSSETRGALKTDLWRMSTPHPAYLTTLVAGELTLVRDEWDGVPLQYAAAPEFADWMAASFEQTPRALEFLSGFTGLRYPFAKYSQVCVDNFPFGGMENISATTMTDMTLRDELGTRDGDSHGLVVHEAAHQWFGDLLTCNDWSHIWLNEGFATYMTLLYFEETLGADDFRVRLRDTQESYLKGDVGQNRRPMVHNVYRDPMDLFSGGHTYEGGAARLHLLRFVLGDDAFQQAIATYVADHRDRGVVTADLRRSVEKSSGRDLSLFFDQWFHKPGFPEFSVKWSYDEKAREVELTIEQVQKADDGTPAVFRTPVDVEVKHAGGARTQRLDLTRRRQSFRLPSEERPTWVRFDKFGWIPKRLDATKSVDELLAIAKDDDDVNGRRDALARLCELALEQNPGKRRDYLTEAIAERLDQDPNATVRAESAEYLGSIAGDRGRVPLMEAATNDPRAKVRVAALGGLKSWGRDPRLAALARSEFEERFSWETMGACAGLLCSSDPEPAFAWIRSRLSIESPHGVLRGLLLEKLELLDHPDVLPLLRAEARDSEGPDRARIAAVGSLGRVGSGSAAVREDLLALLDSGDYQLRRAALDALHALGDPRSLRSLREFYEESVFPRERRKIEAILRSQHTRS